MAEMTELDKRTWAAIDELDECARGQSEENEVEEYETRVNTAAMTMIGLGLGIGCLGDLALCLVEMEKICDETDAEKETGSISDWPDTILED